MKITTWCKMFLSFALLMLMVWSEGKAQLLTENFDYPAGSGDSLVMHGWTPHSGRNAMPLMITSPGLTYGNYAGSGIGNAATVTGGSGSREDAHKSFSPMTQTVYTAFLVNVQSVGNDSDYFFHLGADVIGTTFRSKVFIDGDGSGNFAFGVQYKGNTPVVTGYTYTPGTTYLLVLKTKWGSNSELFINPVIGDPEPAATITSADFDVDPVNYGSVALRQGSRNYNMIVDGIRIDTTWEGAVAATNDPPSAFDLLEPADNFRWEVSESSTDSMYYRWNRSIDPEGSTVYYSFEYDTTATMDSPLHDFYPIGTDTFFVDYAHWEADLLQELGLDSMTMYWRIIATDNDHEVASSQIWSVKFVLIPGPAYFRADLSGYQVVPPTNSQYTGWSYFELNADSTELFYRIYIPDGFTSVTIRNNPAGTGSDDPVLYEYTLVGDSAVGTQMIPIEIARELCAGRLYVMHPGVGIRGQIYPGTDPAILNPATGLSATKFEESVELEWSAPITFTKSISVPARLKKSAGYKPIESFLIGYNVYRSMDGMGFIKIAQTDLPSYVDNNVITGNQYWYFVSAVYLEGQAPWTDTADVSLVQVNSFTEFFENSFPPAGWSLINPNAGSITYSHYIGTNGPSYSGNRAIKMDFYSYSNSGHLDTLKTPIYRNIGNADSLFFDWAYCQYPGYSDRLRVLMSTDGGLNFNVSLFDKTGAALATVPASQSSFTPSSPSHWKTYAYPLGTADSVILAFITTNAYGNNLYIDNIVIGIKPMNDIGSIEFSNILPDTSYKTSSFNPKVLLGNFGNNVCSNFNVTLTINPGGYSSTKSVSELLIGQNLEVEFDEYTITPGSTISLTAFTSFNDDLNRSNDTISQLSTFLPGYNKMVMFEQFTSSTCAPCAASNPSIDAFMHNNDDKLLATKYHVGWPSPGNDPMYLHNPTQSYDRRSYYSVNAVPTLIMESSVRDIPPNAYLFNQAYLKGSPVGLTVVSTRPHPDSIHAVVTVTIDNPLPAGNYYLRVQSIEKEIHYATAPGTNGEKDFYDVFRHAYPNSQGIAITNAPGVYTYEYSYFIDASEVDTMLYTGAFIQNDADKKIINAAKSERTHYVVDVADGDPIPFTFVLENNYPNPFNPVTSIRYTIPEQAKVQLSVYNILGQKVTDIVNTAQTPGRYTVQWNGKDSRGNAVSSGVYFYRLTAGSHVSQKKMLLLK